MNIISNYGTNCSYTKFQGINHSNIKKGVQLVKATALATTLTMSALALPPLLIDTAEGNGPIIDIINFIKHFNKKEGSVVIERDVEFEKAVEEYENAVEEYKNAKNEHKAGTISAAEFIETKKQLMQKRDALLYQ